MSYTRWKIISVSQYSLLHALLLFLSVSLSLSLARDPRISGVYAPAFGNQTTLRKELHRIAPASIFDRCRHGHLALTATKYCYPTAPTDDVAFWCCDEG